MKKKLLFMACLFCLQSMHGQTAADTIIFDTLVITDPVERNGLTSNGGVFTPKGEIRALIVFVRYDGMFDTMPVDGWEPGEARPAWASGQNKAFYTDLSEFNTTNIYADSNRHSVSNYYYQMSQGQFKLTADYYPRTIRVHVDSTDYWGDIHRKVMDTIAITDNTFDWSRYDLRNNYPNYMYDNSQTLPDDTIDLIVFCHRFSRNWEQLPSPKLNTPNADGVASAYSPIDNIILNTNYSYKEGFTIFSGGIRPLVIFVHELGHAMYNGPHYSGQNNVSGTQFYVPAAGWGMMTMHTYCTAMAWERFLLNWISNPNASGVNANFINETNMPDSIVLDLRDFVTTGDAIRVKVASVDTQYLWLEYHTGMSIFDKNQYGSIFCGDSISLIQKGLIAYVEKYSHLREDSLYLTMSNEKANAVRWVHSDGNHDFQYNETAISPQLAYCGNQTYQLYKGKSNSIGGQNIGEHIRHDFDRNGIIEYNQDANQSSNEYTPVICLNGDTTARYYTGEGITFPEGLKVGISHNPCVMNIPKYNQSAKKMEDYYLNGISFRVLEYTDSVARVELRTNDYYIEQSTRWAGTSIVLTDLSRDSSADMVVKKGQTLTIDKSGTPNRHIPYSDAYGENSFVNYTTLSLRDTSLFRQERYSTVDVCNGSTLVIGGGYTYEVGDGATLNIQSTATLQVRNGATLRIKGNGRVDIADGAYICIEPGAILDFQDTLSVINLHNGYQIGRNPVTSYGNDQCSGSLTTNNHLQSFANDVYLQNTVFTRDASVAGRAIYAGEQILPQTRGVVSIKPDNHVIMDADAGTHLMPGVEVKLGAALEIR